MGGKWRKKEEMEEWRKRERKYSNREEIERESLPLSSTFYISSYLFFLSPLRDGRKSFSPHFLHCPLFHLRPVLPPWAYFCAKVGRYRVSLKKVCFRNSRLLWKPLLIKPLQAATQNHFYVFLSTAPTGWKFLKHTFFWDTLYIIVQAFAES